MRPIFGIVAIATVPAWLCVNVNSASAQTFNDRWSIIPKAHAEPAPEAPDQTRQNPLEQPPTGEETLVVRKIAQPLDLQTGCFPERPLTIHIRQEKQRAVPRSIGIH